MAAAVAVATDALVGLVQEVGELDGVPGAVPHQEVLAGHGVEEAAEPELSEVVVALLLPEEQLGDEVVGCLGVHLQDITGGAPEMKDS